MFRLCTYLLFCSLTFLGFAQRSTIVDSLRQFLKEPVSDSAEVMIKTQLAREYVYVDNSKANEYILEAMALAEARGMELEGAYVMRVMGALLRENGFYLRGAEMLLEARVVFEKYGDSLGVANCLLSLARIYSHLGDYNLAVRTNFEARDMYRSLGLKERLGVVYNNIGRIFYDLDKLDSAELYTLKSIEMNLEVENYPLLESNFRNMSLCYFKRGKYDSANYFADQVLKIHSSLASFSNTWAAAESYLLKAKVAMAYEKYDSVPAYLQTSQKISSSYGYLELLKEAMQISFTYYSKLNDQPGLMRAWDRYHVVTDSLFSLEKENKKDIIKWYEERAERELEISAYNSQVIRQKNQIIMLITSVILVLIILIMFVVYNRRERKVNAKLQAQKAALENLNDTKNKLFSIIAHDFRSPLANVYSSSRLIAEHFETLDPLALKEVATELNKSVVNTLSLTDNLLSWAKSQMAGTSANPQKVELETLIGFLVSNHKPIASKKDIEFTLELEAHLTVFADRNEMEVVFRNLITNAIKFSHPGGSVLIKGRREGGSVRVDVEDRGIGMDNKTQEAIFDISKKTDIKGTSGELGTGLGLVLVKDFLGKNGGRIEVCSAPDKGSLFTITLPSS